MVDTETYKLTESNYHKEIYDKTQIIIGHTHQKGMSHYGSWIYRLNGNNKKTANFTIDKNGNIYQHYDPKYYSNFINKDQDKASISIILENLGWFRKDSMVDKYIDWIGNNYRIEPDNVLMKRWRNHTHWDKYSEKQTESLKNLVSKLLDEYNIKKEFIGHNTYDENVDLFKGITFRSNYYQEATDVSPAFDINVLKNI
jgi:N-acetyl-anhydromuramyl-L-alanine amidase AmpD